MKEKQLPVGVGDWAEWKVKSNKKPENRQEVPQLISLFIAE